MFSPDLDPFSRHGAVWHTERTFQRVETEWRMYASVKYTIISSNNGMLPFPRQAIIWSDAG